jgi:hypothetical protein
MLNIFKSHQVEEESEAPTAEDRQAAEYNAFSQWLAGQPDDRREMYLNLAMAYGFNQQIESHEKENTDE